MSVFLHDFEVFLRKRGARVFSVAEICDGREEILHLEAGNRCQDVYSVAKAFAVTAVGLLYDRGLLSPQERVCDILGELCPEGMDPRWKLTTVDMALRHRLGLPRGFLDIDVQPMGCFGGDLLQYMLTFPLECSPGEEESYTDGAFYLISRLAELRAGKPLDSFLWEHIFAPLDFAEAAWSRCPQGHPMGATGLYIPVEGMARLGELYRQGGMYGGRRLLSEAWVKLVLDRGYELRPVGHGAAYGKGGMNGQMLLVIPGQNRVVAWQGYLQDGQRDLIRFACEYSG